VLNDGVPSTSNQQNTYSVYQGFDENGDVRYVGITKRNPQVRFNEHLKSSSNRSELDYAIKAKGLSKHQARTMEQLIINKYGLQKNGGQLYNKINSISPSKWHQYGIKR